MSGPSSHARPTQRSARRIAASDSGVERVRSVSSMRRMNLPPRLLRERVVEERDVRRADVRIAGRRRSDADAHRARVGGSRWTCLRAWTSGPRFITRRAETGDPSGSYAPSRRPRISRSRSTPSSTATRGSRPQRWNPKRFAQRHAAGVVREDEAQERGQAQLRRARDRMLHEPARDPAPLLRGIDVDADLGGRGVRGPAVELAEAEPPQHLAALFPDPHRMAIRQAIA